MMDLMYGAKENLHFLRDLGHEGFSVSLINNFKC